MRETAQKKANKTMNDNEKQLLFEQTPIPAAVAKLAIPSIAASLVMMLYNLADTYFVGYINDPVQNAAVTLAAPMLLAFNAVNNLFGAGAGSMMSRSLGAKNYDNVYRSSAFGIYCAAICGLAFSLGYTAMSDMFLRLLGADAATQEATRQYLFWTVSCGAVPAILNVVINYMVRAEGAALHGSIGVMSGCLLNMVLDPIFIMPWGLGMGAAGAGCATFLSNCFAVLYFLIYIICKRGRTYVCVKPEMALCGKSVAAGVMAVGVPAAIQNLLNVTGMTILNNFTAAFGSAAVAGMGIAQKIQMIPVYMAMGVSNGIMPLIGYNYAAANVKRMKQAVLFTGKIAIAFLALMTLFGYAFAQPLVALFIDTPQVIEYGGAFLKGLVLALPFAGTDFLGVGVFQACGMGRKSLMFAVLRKVVLEIPALFILNALFPMYGLAYAQIVSELVLAAAAVIVLRGLFKQLESKTLKQI